MRKAKPRVLLHVCCGPCATYPVRTLRRDWDVSAYYYNPNVHPEDEYVRRLGAAKQFSEEVGIRFLAAPYDPDQYFRAVGDDTDKPARCVHCYLLRLSATAASAAELGFDAFTTTLLVSPYQDQEAIASAGRTAADLAGAEFLARDFRDGFRDAQSEARERDMYRQDYCGCRHSRAEAEEGRR